MESATSNSNLAALNNFLFVVPIECIPEELNNPECENCNYS